MLRLKNIFLLFIISSSFSLYINSSSEAKLSPASEEELVPSWHHMIDPNEKPLPPEWQEEVDNWDDYGDLSWGLTTTTLNENDLKPKTEEEIIERIKRAEKELAEATQELILFRSKMSPKKEYAIINESEEQAAEEKVVPRRRRRRRANPNFKENTLKGNRS